MLDKDAERLFAKFGVLSKNELHARYDILIERYCKEINIEALTALQMAKRQILPAAMKYSGVVANSVTSIKAAGATAKAQSKLLSDLCSLIDTLQVDIVNLEEAVAKAGSATPLVKQAETYRDIVIPAMGAIRSTADQLETIVDAEMWPLPTYAEMLFLR